MSKIKTFDARDAIGLPRNRSRRDAELTALILHSISEFDGQKITAELLARVQDRIGTLRALWSELTGPIKTSA
jgi:hypothetical protein